MIDLKKYEEKFLIIPLGGVGEIGMNMMLYHYAGKWIMIDLGVGFSDDQFPGTDLVVADISFVNTIRDDLLGIVLTHAHEDHFGAIQYLWEEMRCTVYASPFTAAFLRRKLVGSSIEDDISICEYREESGLALAGFQLTFVHFTHSIPESHGILIEAGGKRVFHSGDWKFDDAPVVGSQTNFAALERIGQEGVDLLLCDSTNIMRDRESGSESSVHETVMRLVSAQKEGTVFATLFASNIARIQTLVGVADACGRTVVLCGTSLQRAVDAAKSVGYLSGLKDFLAIEDAEGFDRDKLFVLCTGCQGEPAATMSKVLFDQAFPLEVRSQDLVIFSSTVIAGNEVKVYRLMNNIVSLGANLAFERTDAVHVSGHPGRPEVKRLYEILRPRAAVPIHGESLHLHLHSRFAREWGVKNTLVIKNGDVLHLSEDNQLEVVERVRCGKYAIDGRFFRTDSGTVMRTRRRMRDHGFMFVNILLSQHGKLAKAPCVHAPGLLDVQLDSGLISDLVFQIEEAIISERLVRISVIKHRAFVIAKRFSKKKMGKYPEIRIQVDVV